MRCNVVFAIFSIACLSSANSKLITPQGGSYKDVDACPFAVDIATVLDTSYSQFDNFAGLKDNLTSAMQYMEIEHPHSKSALTTFTDKPLPPLGWNEPNWKDVCARVIADFSGPSDNMQTELKKLRVGGGYDFPEAQMEAVIRTALSDKLAWRPNYLESGVPVVHVILMVTDSLPHMPDDTLRAAIAWNEAHSGGSAVVLPRPNDLYLNYTGLHDDINFECSLVDYPSFEDVGVILRSQNIIPVIMTTPSGWDCGEATLCPYPEMESLASLTGIQEIADPYLGLPIVYEAALRQMGVTGIVEPLMLESENFYQKFVEVLDQLELIPKDCVTTTSIPTTLTPLLPEGSSSTDEPDIPAGITTSSSTDEPDIPAGITTAAPAQSTEPECIPEMTSSKCEDVHVEIVIDGGLSCC